MPIAVDWRGLLISRLSLSLSLYRSSSLRRRVVVMSQDMKEGDRCHPSTNEEERRANEDGRDTYSFSSIRSWPDLFTLRSCVHV